MNALMALMNLIVQVRKSNRLKLESNLISKNKQTNKQTDLFSPFAHTERYAGIQTHLELNVKTTIPLKFGHLIDSVWCTTLVPHALPCD